MRRHIETVCSLLLLGPLLLGAVASKYPSMKHKETLNTSASESAVEIQAQPTTNVSRLFLSNPDAEAGPLMQGAASRAANYAIDWYSINGGGTVNASSTNYRMGASIGQSVAGSATSTNYQMGIGFWYGASGGDCTCSCWADPTCDGVRSNVQDVVGTVNVAFRGTPGTVDPGCTRERTDVDANGFTNVTDVVRVVNVAFRGNTVASQYVDPCP